MDPLADLDRWVAEAKARPEPVAYIVIDHGWDGRLPHVVGHDAQGKKYALCSPAVMDEARHIPAEKGKPPLFGIPVYRRTDLPKEWPDG